MRPYSRKKKMVDVPMQLQIAVEILLHVLVFLTMMMMVFYVYPVATMFSSASLEEHQRALIQLIELNFSKWPLFLIVGLITGVVSILFSHRFAGPIFKLASIVRKFAAGDFREEARLRTHDYLWTMVGPLNDLRNKWSNDLKTISSELTKQKQSMSGNQVNGAEIKASIERIEAICATYQLPEQQPTESLKEPN